MSSQETNDVLPRRKSDDEADLDITPMIDITFLLLAFFVMVSKMDPQLPVDLPQALNGDVIPEKNCVVLVVLKGAGDDEYSIYKGLTKAGADKIVGDDPVEQEEQIAQYVEETLSRNPTIQTILIKAEGEVTTGAVETVKRGVAGSELGLTRKLYVAVESTQ
ncbi:MAG: biopolymer transporter ExbD [Mariniblastus sp.]|nr:biopolymer transporter ExbD [Mariniblastus sp.]